MTPQRWGRQLPVCLILAGALAAGCSAAQWEAFARELNEGLAPSETTPTRVTEATSSNDGEVSEPRPDDGRTVQITGSASPQLRARYERFFRALERLLELPELELAVLTPQDRNCQTRGSRSVLDRRRPNAAMMILCDEVGAGPVRAWVLFHELWHAAAGGWGEALWDNEDAADEFGIFLMVFTGQRRGAEQVVQWWQERARGGRWVTEMLDRASTQWTDRHALSPERAQRMRRSLAQGRVLERRWIVRLLPHVRTQALRVLATERSDLDLDEIVRTELRRRGLDE